MTPCCSTWVQYTCTTFVRGVAWHCVLRECCRWSPCNRLEQYGAVRRAVWMRLYSSSGCCPGWCREYAFALAVVIFRNFALYTALFTRMLMVFAFCLQQQADLTTIKDDTFFVSDGVTFYHAYYLHNTSITMDGFRFWWWDNAHKSCDRRRKDGHWRHTRCAKF